MTHPTPGCLGLQNIAGSEAPPLLRRGWGDPSEWGPAGGFPKFHSGRRPTPSGPGLSNAPLAPLLHVPRRTLITQLEDYSVTVCLRC